MAQSAKVPAYPRVSLATWYQVDPSWPHRPKDCAWGAMPGLAVDAQDHVWVFTRAVPPVQVYSLDGQFIRAWGQDHVKNAHSIRLDPQGMVWLADIGNHLVMQFTPEGKLLRTLGTQDRPGCDESHFDQPTDMVITPAGDIFVADGYGNNRIVHFDKTGKYVKSWGKLGTAPGEFSLPHAIVMDSRGRLYVADRNNVRIQVFDQNGTFLDEWRNRLVPWGLWMTGRDEIWACGSSPMPWIPAEAYLGVPPKDQLFMKFDTSGKMLQLWTVPKGNLFRTNPGECTWLHAVAVDSKGNIYAGDIQGQRAQKFVKQN